MRPARHEAGRAEREAEAGVGCRLGADRRWGEMRTGEMGVFAGKWAEKEEQIASSCGAGTRWAHTVHGHLEGVPQEKKELGGNKRGSKAWPPCLLEVNSAADPPAWQAALSHSAPQPRQHFSSCLPSPGQTLEFQQKNGKRARSKVVCHSNSPSHPWSCCRQQWLEH